MALNGIGSSASEQPSALSRSADEAPEQRALVVVPPIDAGESPNPYSRRPDAPFLAQLIATARGEPQTRAHCRAAPDAAAQAYAATFARLSDVISRNS